MCSGVCSKCKKVFIAPGSFESHPCVTELRKLSDIELLEGLYKSGGCSKEYYEREKAKQQQDQKFEQVGN